jgi:hypothetical protein
MQKLCSSVHDLRRRIDHNSDFIPWPNRGSSAQPRIPCYDLLHVEDVWAQESPWGPARSQDSSLAARREICKTRQHGGVASEPDGLNFERCVALRGVHGMLMAVNSRLLQMKASIRSSPSWIILVPSSLSLVVLSRLASGA